MPAVGARGFWGSATAGLGIAIVAVALGQVRMVVFVARPTGGAFDQFLVERAAVKESTLRTWLEGAGRAIARVAARDCRGR